MSPSLTPLQIEAFDVAGITVRTCRGDEEAVGRAQIPTLWQRFHAEGIAKRIPALAEDAPILAVYHAYESDFNGPYSLVIGHAVPGTSFAPANLARVRVPAGRYLMFPVRGELPFGVIAAWQEIWRQFAVVGSPRRAYQADFERYYRDRAAIFVGLAD